MLALTAFSYGLVLAVSSQLSGLDPFMQDAKEQVRQTTVAGAFSRCKSGYGVYDMSGNAAEWTSSLFDPNAPDKAVKGGHAARPSFDDRCASRRKLRPTEILLVLAFGYLSLTSLRNVIWWGWVTAPMMAANFATLRRSKQRNPKIRNFLRSPGLQGKNH